MAVRKRRHNSRLVERNLNSQSSSETKNILRRRIWLLFPVTAVAIATFLWCFRYHDQNPRQKLVLTDPEVEMPPSYSLLKQFKQAAVSSDAVPCSKIGRNILIKNGSAADAAIATLLCCGIINMEAMGIGGGFLMTVYSQAKKAAYSVNARESAPLAIRREMFSSSMGDSLYDPSRTGALSVGVPGELMGYWEVWQKFGRLPWKYLVSPSVALCYEGYELSKPQREALNFRPETPRIDTNLRSWFVDSATGQFKKWGSKIVPRRLCETYERIAEEGGLILHGGSLTSIFVDDIKELGGILDEDDMIGYQVDWKDPVAIHLGANVLYSAPPPGSGVLLCHILQILNGYHLSTGHFSTTRKTVASIHRIVESFKFAFGKRGFLGDPKYVNVTSILSDLTSPRFAERIRRKIDLHKVFEDALHYGSSEFKASDYGTNHVSVLTSEGDAVAVTSTINLYFGAGFTSKRTGIILNSVIDDFSIPNVTNYFGLPLTTYNQIEPGKRPMSSACPSILVGNEGEVKLVFGASGGSRITTAVAWILIRVLWLGENLKEAIDASRIHHQLSPMVLSYEFGTLKQVVDGLKKLGHTVKRYTVRGSVISALHKTNGSIFGNADFRKFGGVEGID